MFGIDPEIVGAVAFGAWRLFRWRWPSDATKAKRAAEKVVESAKRRDKQFKAIERQMGELQVEAERIARWVEKLGK